MKSSLRPLTLIAGSLFLVLGALSASATPITFAATGTGTDGALSASAVFTVTNGQIQVTLTNLDSASSVISSGQLISGLSFTLSNPDGALGATTASGQMGTLNGSDTVTYTTGSPTRFLGAGGKGSLTATGDTVALDALGGGQPSELIAPALANGGTYTDANGGFGNFTPYTIGPATFTLDLSGVTADTTISDVTFSFGTSGSSSLPGTLQKTSVTPEPSSLLLIGTGCLALAALLRRRISFRSWKQIS